VTTATIRGPIGSFVLDASPVPLATAKRRAADRERAIAYLASENRRLLLQLRQASAAEWLAQRQRRAAVIMAMAAPLFAALVVALAG